MEPTPPTRARTTWRRFGEKEKAWRKWLGHRRTPTPKPTPSRQSVGQGDERRTRSARQTINQSTLPRAGPRRETSRGKFAPPRFTTVRGRMAHTADGSEGEAHEIYPAHTRYQPRKGSPDRPQKRRRAGRRSQREAWVSEKGAGRLTQMVSTFGIQCSSALLRPTTSFRISHRQPGRLRQHPLR